MSNNFLSAVDDLLRFFRDVPRTVDFKTTYRTRLPSSKVETVAKWLEHVGDVFQAGYLREAYQKLLKLIDSEPVDPDSLTLTAVEERRLAAMNEEDRRLAMEHLHRLGSEEELRQDLQVAADDLVTLLEGVNQGHDTGGRGVSLQDAAECVRLSDPDGQGELVKRWRNSRDPKLPESIGKSPEHSQRKLYEPAAFLRFLKKVEGAEADRDYRLSAHFRKVSRLPRPAK